MGEKIDDLKGRLKEGVGEATDNDRLENEGRMDQAGATVKDKANKAVDKVKDAFTRD